MHVMRFYVGFFFFCALKFWQTQNQDNFSCVYYPHATLSHYSTQYLKFALQNALL